LQLFLEFLIKDDQILAKFYPKKDRNLNLDINLNEVKK
jgi:hypothetical protein